VRHARKAPPNEQPLGAQRARRQAAWIDIEIGSGSPQERERREEGREGVREGEKER